MKRKNSQKLLTILVPAYNVEKYIEQALRTIIKSKYIDLIEVLVVNDGSKDDTVRIVKRLQKQCNSIVLVNKENGGHGSTINVGIELAAGKYFRIMDGDDWFNTEDLDEYLSKLMSEKSDLVLTDLVECFMKNELKKPVSYYTNLTPFKTLDVRKVVFNEWGPMLPTSTIKTSVLRSIDFKIDEKCFYVDQEYNLLCYLTAKTVTYYPFFIYQYRLEREGQSMEKASLIKNVSSHEKVCIRLASEYSKNLKSLSETQKIYIRDRILIPMCNMQYMLVEEWCMSRSDFLSFDNKLKIYPELYNNPKVSGTLTNLYRKTGGLLIGQDKILRRLSLLMRSKKINWILNKKTLLISFLSLISILGINLLTINYINSEKTVHYWDTSGYWTATISLFDTLKIHGKLGVVDEIANSMYTDYNLLPVVPLLPILRLFGVDRMAFILSILNLYVIPFAIIYTLVIYYIFKKSGVRLKYWIYPILLSIFLFLPSIITPVVFGRPDAIGLLIISVILLYIAKTGLKRLSSFIILGIMTFTLIVVRRYFSFWGVSLYITLSVLSAVTNIYKNGFNSTTLKNILKSLIKLSISGLTIIIIMFLFLNPLLSRYIGGNYSDTYSAYMLGDFLNQIYLFLSYHGIIVLILAGIGYILSLLYYRKTTIHNIAIQLLLQAIIIFCSFSLVQTLGDQHMYMIVPSISIPIAILVAYLSEKNNILKYLSLIPIALIVSLSIYSFSGSRVDRRDIFIGVADSVKPIVRSDFDELHRLDAFLRSTVPQDESVYILSSSDVLNESILVNLNLPEYPAYRVLNTHHIDKRDGFPSHFFDANYIIVSDPIQTHVNTDGQKVITVLSDMVLNGDFKNLRKVREYRLMHGVKVKIYVKYEDYSNESLVRIKESFMNSYPNHGILWKNIPTNN